VRRVLPFLLALALAACGGDIDTPSSTGPDLARIRVVGVETRVAQNADIHWGDGEAQVRAAVTAEGEPQNPVVLTAREREALLREKIREGVNGAVLEELAGLPAGDLAVIVEVLVTRYRIRSLLRGALLGSDHIAEATVTLRDAATGRPVSEPLAVSAESTEQVAALGGLQLRAVRPDPFYRLNGNLADEVRAALDRVAAGATAG
jgi:hypothetical protein